MREIDPIYVSQRPVQCEWGRDDLGEWGRLAPLVKGPVGEIWLHPGGNESNVEALGNRLSAGGVEIFGDIGRAPPRMRLVFPGGDVDIASTAPLSLWTILEPGSDDRPDRWRRGERVRAYEGAAVRLPAGSVALEVSSAFQPRNRFADEPSLIHLPPVSQRTRATLMREDALSVEMWTLPERSWLSPDGETCHVIMAITSGVALDGRQLGMGETAFIPAHGRAVDLTARQVGAKIIVAYPDGSPTAIWRHTPGPDPALLPKPEPWKPAIDSLARLPAAA